MKLVYRKKKALSQLQYIALGYMLIILVGALLLSTPLASRTHTFTPFLTSLFTATSATCVTGLVLVDTATHWNFFGQFIIISLIQIGGLGFITIGIFFALFMRHKIGLRQRGLIKESLNVADIGGAVKLTKKILYGTLIIESIGAILLSIKFIPIFGLCKGIWYGIFHSISAFCNAGFDLMGIKYGEYASLTNFYGDSLVNIVTISLILIGGIGFIVWDDVTKYRLKFKSYRLHTKITLSMSLILVFGGAILFYLTERKGIFVNMSFKERVLSSLFAAVSPRTAGFNTVDTMKMSQAGKLLTVILMYIGAGSGSTAGGIKISTMFVILSCIYTSITRKYGLNAFGRRIDDEAIKSGMAISALNMILIIIGTMIILTVQNMNEIDVIYEVTSAMSTVGMTVGITRDMNIISRIVIILLMYLGRVGGLTFALSFSQNKKVPKLRQVVENISIG